MWALNKKTNRVHSSVDRTNYKGTSFLLNQKKMTKIIPNPTFDGKLN